MGLLVEAAPETISVTTIILSKSEHAYQAMEGQGSTVCRLQLKKKHQNRCCDIKHPIIIISLNCN